MQPMTLEEAVEIVECGRFDYCHPRGPDYDHSDARAVVWDRARAIVDQAVEAHNARCELDDYDGSDRTERLLRVEACFEALAKLRALERGESEGKP